MDTRELRNCFGCFATGVTVITWMNDDGQRRGITVNSFTSVSLDPPLVLISIDKKTKAFEELKNKSFVINILSADQAAYALQFAGRPQADLEVEWEETLGPLPALKGTVAHFKCSPWKEYEGGDHLLFVGKVEDFSYNQKESLLFYRGKFFETADRSILAANS
ncbi:flavin reductase family protein [Siminovitchia sp. FSL H7-0308]|uniref:Flavin reductase (DIM6/NTAB) family NADH-FMN oxidoreductase RutF n=1 Tax=Siminovitchia thermophila TaxID=1245522 RepID=A0ABS2R0S0_9BACI|nr:flavin reductase family protein [Siminovitchia thermophila]MBM7713228.1 flavin reductase (DIM6/NTAB) family NADH-FMN oxidoreductase RutF [Siminovitchia thermophila]